MRIGRIYYTSKFARNFKKLPVNVRGKAAEREKIFRKDPFDKRLKTHKLRGPLKDFYSFSIGYKYRILFSFEDKNEVTFIDVGTHQIYRLVVGRRTS